jgi:acyl-CoA synthetase (AMP-forming)/AMP-acid ligase II
MQAIRADAFSDLSIWKKISRTPAELIEFCRGRLAHFKCPKYIEFKALPKTSTEKSERTSSELNPAPTGIENSAG